MKRGISEHPNSVINEKGVAIATAMFVVLILTLLGGALLLTSMREMNISLKSESSNQAFHVAEAGIEYATNKILNGEIVVDYPDTTVAFGPGKFVVSIDREVDYNIPQVKYTISSVGIVEDTQVTQVGWLPSLIDKLVPAAFADDNQKTLTVTMTQEQPFTEYVFFMDEKQDTGYDFIAYYQMGSKYDVITGTVHANSNAGLGYDLSIYSNIKTNGYPLFNGIIDKDGDGLVDESVTYVNGINIVGNPTFKPVLPAKVDLATFPAINDYTFLENKAGYDWVFQGDTTVTLNENSLTINNVNKGLSSGNGVLYVHDGDVSVSGTLDGRLTIVSAGGSSGGNIKIVGNITYANEDIVPSETASDDMLGLIANKDIVIPNTSSVDSINATMLAENGSIWYESWDNSGMGSKGTLTVNGSLIQKTDFDVIQVKGKHFGKIDSGFLKRYNYDKRLYYLEPPYFFKPDKSLYEIIWK